MPSPATSQDLPAHDGARFCAASFVMLGHSINSLLTFNPQLPGVLVLHVLVAVGMSLFFTLSGFLIHYNYAGTILTGSEAIARFFVARFARLAPLYFLFVTVALGVAWNAADFPVAIYYLGLAQSWVYVQYDGLALLSQLRGLPITWSISTEWFLYCIYPLLALLMARGGAIIFAAILVSYMALLSLCYLYPEILDGPAHAIWGPSAVDRANGNNLFYAWVLNYSPIGRLHEFMSGMLAAQIYSAMRNRPRSALNGYLLAALSIAILYAIYGSLQFTALVPWTLWINATTVFFIPLGIALFLFTVARYRTVFSAFLGSRPMVAAGDATYSLYLFHGTALQIVAINAPLPPTWFFIGLVSARYFAVITMSLIFCMGTYRVFEAPMRSFIRRRINTDRRPIAAAIILLFIGIPVSLATYGWFVSLSGR
jgi:peptidoglycan/LPS O-acetylase OafA/YrhL